MQVADGDISSKGALGQFEIDQSRINNESRAGSIGPITAITTKVKYVNLQALIDREIIVD